MPVMPGDRRALAHIPGRYGGSAATSLAFTDNGVSCMIGGSGGLDGPGGGRTRGPRILIYSHDTYGLGHLRRSRAIANALVARHPDVSILIISGSPVIGSFEFGDGVDYVRVPGVVKLPNGDYTSLNLNVDIDEAVRLREAIIRQTADSFDPDVLIVDKEPTGFRGELIPTLDMLRTRGTRLVLGVRDVMDEPSALAQEWERKDATRALCNYYDDVFVYGLADIYEPLASLDLPRAVAERLHYTGYLRRALPKEPNLVRYPRLTKGPFLLVTTGGGGDGDNLVDWVISAYEADRHLPLPALVAFGPFIARETRRAFMERIARLPDVDAISFDAKIENLMNRAAGVVAMGGYNTFCEILSLDKRALIVPRARPRLEQTIRARRAAALGLVCLLEDPSETGEGERDPAAMAQALRELAGQPPPSQAFVPGLLDGLDRIVEWISPWLEGRRRQGREIPAAAE